MSAAKSAAHLTEGTCALCHAPASAVRRCCDFGFTPCSPEWRTRDECLWRQDAADALRRLGSGTSSKYDPDALDRADARRGVDAETVRELEAAGLYGVANIAGKYVNQKPRLGTRIRAFFARFASSGAPKDTP